MTRSRAIAIYDKVNLLLSTCDFNTPLDSLLPNSNTLFVISYNPQGAKPSRLKLEEKGKEAKKKRLKKANQCQAQPTGVATLIRSKRGPSSKY
jgi:hypothetical protein